MTYGFQRTATGRIVLRVDQVERGLLGSVARQVIDLVKPEEPSADQDPLAAQLGWIEGRRANLVHIGSKLSVGRTTRTR